MTLTIRLPDRVAKKLAEYCAQEGLTQSEAICSALDGLLATAREPNPYELGADLVGPHTDKPGTEDVARRSKRLLQGHFRSKRR